MSLSGRDRGLGTFLLPPQKPEEGAGGEPGFSRGSRGRVGQDHRDQPLPSEPASIASSHGAGFRPSRTRRTLQSHPNNTPNMQSYMYTPSPGPDQGVLLNNYITRCYESGASRDRTGDLKLAKLALSQLSYGPDPDGYQQRQK